MNISKLKTASPFEDLFPVDAEVLKAVLEDMREYGYDPAQPIVLWQEKNIVVDGHTRLLAAREVGINDVPVDQKEFESEDEALAYAIHAQKDRRNMTGPDILRCVQALDRRKPHGGDRKSKKIKTSGEVLIPSRSSKETAAIIGTSPATVERARTILDHGDEKTVEEVISGEKSINKAYQETQEKRIHEPKKIPTFSQTNDNIEWAKWTWNPVTGCEHGCEYCYARDIANRFHGDFQPKFHPDRLSAPKNTPVPKSDEPGSRNVFVCSMADLFGEWVAQEWIDKVFDAVRNAPEWNFLFLTKNPKRMVGQKWPENAWIGATADTQERYDAAHAAFNRMVDEDENKNIKFISFEPLEEPISLCQYRIHTPDLKQFFSYAWVIIGGRSASSGMPAGQPEWEWVESILRQARDAGCQVYFKPNLTVRPKEYPEG